ERHGYTYGTGVGDLARVLRLPGSINRKTDQPRACSVAVASGELHDPADFPSDHFAYRSTPQLHGEAEPPPGPSSASPGSWGCLRGPFDVVDQYAQWADILAPAGWTFVKTEASGAQLWLRPGGAMSEYSARCFAHNVVVHSEQAGLPTGAGQRLTKARVFAHLWHGGNETDAARDLIAASRHQPCTFAAASLPRTVLAAIQELTAAAIEPR